MVSEWFECGSPGGARAVLDTDLRSGISRDGYGRITSIGGVAVAPFHQVAQEELAFLSEIGYSYVGARCWGQYAAAEGVRFQSPLGVLDIFCVYVQNQLEGPFFFFQRLDPGHRLDLEPLIPPHVFDSDLRPVMRNLASWLRSDAIDALDGSVGGFDRLLDRGARLAAGGGWDRAFSAAAGQSRPTP